MDCCFSVSMFLFVELFWLIIFFLPFFFCKLNTQRKIHVDLWSVRTLEWNCILTNHICYLLNDAGVHLYAFKWLYVCINPRRFARYLLLFNFFLCWNDWTHIRKWVNRKLCYPLYWGWVLGACITGIKDRTQHRYGSIREIRRNEQSRKKNKSLSIRLQNCD